MEHSPWDAGAWKKLLAACDKLDHDGPAFAVCNRLLQRDPGLAPIYLHRSWLQGRKLNVWGAWADQLCSGYFGAIDHPDWTAFADAATTQGWDAGSKGLRSEAVRQYTLASLWQPHVPWPLLRLAWAQLEAGDAVGFRSTCRDIKARFGNLVVRHRRVGG